MTIILFDLIYNKMKSLKDFLLNVFRLLLANNFSFLINFIFVIIFLRVFSPETYGIYVLIYSTATLFQLFINGPLHPANFNLFAKFSEQKKLGKVKSLLFFSAILEIALAFTTYGLAFLAAPWLTHIFKGFNIVFFRVYLLTIIFMSLDQTSRSLYHWQNQFTVIALLDILRSAFKLAGLLCVVFFFSKSLMNVINSIVLTFLLIFLINLWVFYRALKVNKLLAQRSLPLAKQDQALYRNIFLNGYISSSLRAFSDNIVVILLGILNDPLGIAIYRLAYNISYPYMFISNSISIVQYPSLTKLWIKGQGEQLGRIIRRSSLFISLLCIPLAILCYYLYSFLLRFVIKNPALLASIPTVAILLVGFSIYLIFYWGYSLVYSTNKHYLANINTAIQLIVLAGFGLLLIPYYGFNGAAWATTMALIVSAVVYFFQTNKSIPILRLRSLENLILLLKKKLALFTSFTKE